MTQVFASIEQWPLSVWAREADHVYFIALILHAWGMALLVGGGLVVCLRVLGVGSSAALHRFRGFFPAMWLGAALALASGLALLVAYPAKAFTNPVFAVKFICLAAAALLMRQLSRTAFAAEARGELPPANCRAMAAAALLLWMGGVAAGKLLLHTYRVLQVSG